MALIFLMSSVPGDTDAAPVSFMLMIEPGLQNLLHIPLFGTLQFLWLRAFAKMGCHGRGTMLVGLAVTVAYGFVDEYHQTFIPGRYASLTDISLNFTGAFVGAGFFVFFRRQLLARERAR